VRSEVICRRTIVVALLLAACGGNKPSTTSKPSGKAGDGVLCSKQEIALSCPDGQIDFCTKRAAHAEGEPDKPDDGEEETGGTGTAMALEEGALNATHKCVPE
jgi:hypothetical protein